MPESQVVISQRGSERLQSGHLWIYRSDIRRADAGPGDLVRLVDDRGRFLGRAFYSDRSQIAVRLLTRDDIAVDRAYFTRCIQAAADYRKRVVQDTEVYRLLFAGSDGVPSLIVDRYADYLVIQTLSQSAEKRKGEFCQILQELFSPRGIVERNDPKVRLLEGLDQRVSILSGEVPAQVARPRNGMLFAFDLLKGQKTGGFLDQRENRAAARTYASGEVLDCFSYQGGFALTVANSAAHVEAIDLSPMAVEAGRRNKERNGITTVTFREANAFDVLKECDEVGRRFDMIILDPPALRRTARAFRPPGEVTKRSTSEHSKYCARAGTWSPAPAPITFPNRYSCKS